MFELLCSEAVFTDGTWLWSYGWRYNGPGFLAGNNLYSRTICNGRKVCLYWLGCCSAILGYNLCLNYFPHTLQCTNIFCFCYIVLFKFFIYIFYYFCFIETISNTIIGEPTSERADLFIQIIIWSRWAEIQDENVVFKKVRERWLGLTRESLFKILARSKTHFLDPLFSRESQVKISKETRFSQVSQTEIL